MTNVTNDTITDPCLMERNWYKFLASSLIFFGAGLLVILVYRFILWLCFRHGKNVPVSKVSDHAGPLPPNGNAHKNSIPAQGAPGVGFIKNTEHEIGWMTEAKDWAGELISGQTTTGRILVSWISPSDTHVRDS